MPRIRLNDIFLKGDKVEEMHYLDKQLILLTANIP